MTRGNPFLLLSLRNQSNLLFPPSPQSLPLLKSPLLPQNPRSPLLPQRRKASLPNPLSPPNL